MTQIKVDPHTVWIDSVSIERVDADRDGLLRGFRAEVMVRDVASGELSRIGGVGGLIVFEATDAELVIAAEALDDDAGALADAADELRGSLGRGGDASGSTMVLIQRIRIDEHWRGGRISGQIIDHLLEVLHLDPAKTLLVMEPGAQMAAATLVGLLQT